MIWSLALRVMRPQTVPFGQTISSPSRDQHDAASCCMRLPRAVKSSAGQIERRQGEFAGRRADLSNRVWMAPSGAGMPEANRQPTVLRAGIRRRRAAAGGAPGRLGRLRGPAAPRGCLFWAGLVPPAARSGHCAGLKSSTRPGSREGSIASASRCRADRAAPHRCRTQSRFRRRRPARFGRCDARNLRARSATRN